MIYTYLITDTANDKIDSECLMLALQKEESLTIKCLSVSYDTTSIYVSFADTLPGTQEADYLDGIIAAHDGCEVVKYEKYQEMLPTGGPKVFNKGFQFTVPNGTTHVEDYTFTADILVAQGFLHSEGQSILDKITLDLVHPLAGVIHRYVEDYPINPNGSTYIANKAITEQNLKDLIMRVTYTSTGAEDVKCNCGIDGRLAE